MVIVDIVDGNLLDTKEKYICHQCNCLSKTSYGLSKSIANKFKWADIYKIRAINSYKKTHMYTVGNVIEFKNPMDENSGPNILCFISQMHPSKFKKSGDDTYSNRKIWFQECLQYIDNNNYPCIAMPYNIGCGLAGGKWDDYEKMLQECKTEIVLYRL